MRYKRRLADGGSPSPSSGNGKLTEYKGKSDSWILNQMKTKTIDPAIKRKNDSSNTKFYNYYKKDPNNTKLIASRIVCSSFITKVFACFDKNIVKIFLSLAMTSDIVNVEDLTTTSKLLMDEALIIKKTINYKTEIHKPVFVSRLNNVVVKIQIQCDENIEELSRDLLNNHGITKMDIS